MVAITNGNVEYEHPNKVGDYVIPKAKVSLSFIVDPAEDAHAAISSVGSMAHSIAVAMATKSIAQAQGAPNPPPPATRSRTKTADAPPATPPNGADTQNPASGSTADGPGPTATTGASLSDPFAAVAAPNAIAEPATSAAPATGTVLPSPVPETPNPKLSDNGLRQALQAKIAAEQPGASQQVMHANCRALVALFTGKDELPIQAVGDVAKRIEFIRRLDANEWPKPGEVLA